MRVQTEEWRRFIPGIRMYKDKKTLFYNGEILWDDENKEYLVYDEEKRETWEVIMVLPGVEVIPEFTFLGCSNIMTVIMSDSVKRIEHEAFSCCWRLNFVRLSKNIEYIGVKAFQLCKSLTSIFIPESCREIDYQAFKWCKKLIVLSVPQHTTLGNYVIEASDLLSYYNDEDKQNQEKINSWIKSMNQEKEFDLHRECASCNPSEDVIYGILKERGISSFYGRNKIGITAYQYLQFNPFFEMEELTLIKRFVHDMMDETITN